jgi:hypothetical protein
MKYAKYVSVSVPFPCCFVTYIECVYLNAVTNYHKTERVSTLRDERWTQRRGDRSL